MTISLRTLVSAEKLRAILPRCANPDAWVDPLNAALARFGIVANDELAAFFAQVAVESRELNRLEENLNYTAERLCAVWPGRFPNVEIARPYAGNPQQLAMFVYGKRLKLGNETAEDGWRYRGRGLIQITGKANYAACAEGIHDSLLVQCPERLQTKAWAALSAAWYWRKNPRISILAHDAPDDDDQADFVTVTRLVNGGTTGLTERRVYWERAKRAFTCPPKSPLSGSNLSVETASFSPSGTVLFAPAS